MNQFWSTLLGSIITALTANLGNLGPILQGWLMKWLGTASLPDAGDIIKLGNAPGAAPDQVLAMLDKFITDFIMGKLASHPWLASILQGRIQGIVDQVINSVWDSLFPALPKPAMKVMASAPLKLSKSELDAACAQAGLSA